MPQRPMTVPDMDSRAWLQFRQCRLLMTMPEAALRDLFAEAEARSYAPGEALVKQGDPAEGLLVVLDGTAHARLNAPDGKHWLGSFHGGDLVGEMALVTREPRTADVIADTDVSVLLIPTPVFERVASRHPELWIVLTQLVADRLGQKTHDGLGGKRIEGFRILSCIGRGGMSVVYRAREEATGIDVALKMMSYRLIYEPDAVARFRQESEVLKQIRHENVARLERLFPAYHTYFLVMELCEGVDLHQLVHAHGPLPESTVRPLIGQVARALDHVHKRGLVHRDLKPANMMVTRDGQVKLMDFGLAIPIVLPEDDRTLAPERQVLGTPAFMAPEQWSHRPVTPKTDIYALGCVIYELLTGQTLFPSKDLFDLMQEKFAARVPPASAIGGGISSELHAFVAAAVRPDPDERPESLDVLASWAAPCASLPDAAFAATPPRAGD